MKKLRKSTGDFSTNDIYRIFGMIIILASIGIACKILWNKPTVDDLHFKDFSGRSDWTFAITVFFLGFAATFSPFIIKVWKSISSFILSVLNRNKQG